jgi:hypothetical protein
MDSVSVTLQRPGRGDTTMGTGCPAFQPVPPVNLERRAPFLLSVELAPNTCSEAAQSAGVGRP